MTEDVTPLLHPQPRRHYGLDGAGTNSSLYSPTTSSQDFSRLPGHFSWKDVGSKLERDVSTSSFRSVLNLTSSTLSGIYTPSVTSGMETSRDQPSSPTGYGDQTFRHSIDDKKPPVLGPYERPRLQTSPSYQHHQSFLEYILPLGLRTTLLFSFGVAYGVIVSHLHDHQQVAPVQLEGIEQSSWGYLMAWGGVGVLLGGLLPWIDVLWEEVLGGTIEVFASKPQDSRPADASEDQGSRHASILGSGLSADWHPSVRSVGAFIGIAFAIRRLPWQSISQVSLTLALVNPVLWYLVDRSKPGFLLSMIVGLAGTAIAFGINPEIVPSPAASSPGASATNIPHNSGGHGGLVSNESIGVGIWIASVLFCSSVCFGNIGRRFARVAGPPSWRSSVTI